MHAENFLTDYNAEQQRQDRDRLIAAEMAAHRAASRRRQDRRPQTECERAAKAGDFHYCGRCDGTPAYWARVAKVNPRALRYRPAAKRAAAPARRQPAAVTKARSVLDRQARAVAGSIQRRYT